MVVNPNEVALNSVVYPLVGELQPRLISNFPEKSVVGDYTADSNPLASSWVTYDLLGGIGSSTYDTGAEKHCWWTNCIVEYEGNIVLPRLAVALSNNTTATLTGMIINYDMELTTGWTNGARSAVQAHGGTYSWSINGANNAYQDIGYLPSMSCTFTGYVFAIAANEGRIGIDDGVTTTWSDYVAGDSAWHQATVTKTLSSSATRLRLLFNTPGANTAYYDDVTLTVTFTLGTFGCCANFNGSTYWANGNFLTKVNRSTGKMDVVYIFTTSIKDLVPSLNSRLYVYLGDSANYWYMSTAEAFTQSNSANAYWGFQWDNKLFKVNTSGSCAYSTDPDGAAPTWTAKGTITDIASQIESFELGDDYIDGTVPYCATNTKLRFHDFTNALWIDTTLKLPGHSTGGMGFTHWRDGLYVSSNLDVLKFQSAQVPMITNVSMLKGGGIPLEYNGSIIKLCGEGINEMFALVDASQVSGTQKSGLYAYDEIGWRCWWVDTNNDASMHDITVSSTGSAYSVYWDCGGVVYYIDLPQGVRNPTYLSTQTYAASGTLLTSYFDGGWLVGNKRANRVRIGTKGVSATETLVVKYRTDKTNMDLDTGWTTLGTITSGTETIYTFGSGAGSTFSSIQFRVDFARGSTNTNTPVLKYITLEYNKIIPKVWGWQMVLNCSVDYREVPAKTLLENLITAAETETLIAFKYQDTTYYVEIESVQGSRLTGESNKGHYLVIVREVM